MDLLKKLFVEEEGQGMTEYGLVLGVIAIAVVGTLVALREQISEMFTEVYEKVRDRDNATIPTSGSGS